VIQHILEIDKGQNCVEIYNSINGKVYDLSIHRYASNIIERCLYFGTNEQKNDLIDEVLKKEDNSNKSIISLVKDKYGNYVVQKMIENSNNAKKDEIIKKIMNSSLSQKKEGYTKHVFSYIVKIGNKINSDKIQSSININNDNNIQNKNVNIIKDEKNLDMSNNSESEDEKDEDNFIVNENDKEIFQKENFFSKNFININNNYNNTNLMNNKANYNVNLENINFQKDFEGFINNSQKK
jgi:hypothetical protein